MMIDKTPAGVAPANDDMALREGQDEYLRIGDMAKEFGVTLRTLRFYEDKGLLTPRREGTTRLYSRRERGRLKLILLGRKVGFSLRDVKQVIDVYDPVGSNSRQLRLALEKSEKQMLRLRRQRDMLDEAIGDLGGLIDNVRKMITDRTVMQAAAS